MRFTLYGEGEGVLCGTEHPISVSVLQGTIVDATISARKLGIQPGMRIQAAESLAPGLSIRDMENFVSSQEMSTRDTQAESTSVMQRVWETLWTHSPWLETVDDHAFFLQIPGAKPPLREARNILKIADGLLSEEQRLRVGMAENPFLARALVAWSRVERIDGAEYFKVGRQQWIVSPTMSAWSVTKSSYADASAWYQRMPVECLWPLPSTARAVLKKLGVRRLGDFSSIPLTQWKRHFGREALQWFRFLHQEPGGLVRVNYPPQCYRERWDSIAGEEPDVREASSLLETMVEALAERLSKAGVGALKLKMTWETDAGQGKYQRIAKRPAFQSDFLYVSLQPCLSEMAGRRLKELQILAEEIRPLTAVQSMFTVHNGAFVPAYEENHHILHKVLAQVNRKFPQSLQVGVRPKFRELRLQAVLELAREWRQRA